MGEVTGISWTHSTFNPWRGCQKVSPGCTSCYAETLSKRNPALLGQWGPPASGGTRVIASPAMWREPLRWNAEAAKTGRQHRVFCSSLADVFEDLRELDEPRTWPTNHRGPLAIHAGVKLNKATSREAFAALDRVRLMALCSRIAFTCGKDVLAVTLSDIPRGAEVNP